MLEKSNWAIFTYVKPKWFKKSEIKTPPLSILSLTTRFIPVNRECICQSCPCSSRSTSQFKRILRFGRCLRSVRNFLFMKGCVVLLQILIMLITYIMIMFNKLHHKKSKLLKLKQEEDNKDVLKNFLHSKTNIWFFFWSLRSGDSRHMIMNLEKNTEIAINDRNREQENEKWSIIKNFIDFVLDFGIGTFPRWEYVLFFLCRCYVEFF